MIELTLVFLLVAGIFLVPWIIGLGIPASTLTTWGLALLAFGLLVGIPAGLYYHVVLYRILGPQGRLPPRWWLSPSTYHVHLEEEEARRIRRWFVLGGVGFLCCLAGGALALSGLGIQVARPAGP